MGQISAGTANVTNGSNTVSLPGSDISAVVTGHAFHIPGIDAVYSIIGTVPAASPPTIQLSVPYVGINATGVAYRITTGFSPIHNLYEPDPGDVDIPMLLKHRLVRAIDGGLSGAGNQKTILSYSGSDDTAKMMNMLADCGNIILPAGYTAWIDPIFIYANTHKKAGFFGLGGLATIMLKNGSNADMITFDGTNQSLDTSVEGSYFRSENIIFNGNKANQTGGSAVLRLRNASYTIISRSIIYKGYGDGIVIENYQASYDSDEINIDNNMVFFNGGNGIRFNSTVRPSDSLEQGPADHIIINNHINYNGGHGISGGSTGHPGLTATLIQGNNILTNSGSGVHLVNAVRNVISGNQIRYNGYSGVYMEGDIVEQAWNMCGYNQIIGNQIHLNTRSGHGCNLDIWRTKRSIIMGNYLGDWAWSPINNYGMQLAYCDDMTITGNVSEGLYAGALFSHCNRISATGNTFGYVELDGVAGTSNYGLQASDCVDLALTNNIFRGAIDGTSFVNSTYVASGNKGLGDKLAFVDGSIQVGVTYTTPEAYGAKFDGSDDTAALTNALVNGDHLFLKPGRTYSTTGISATNRNYIKIFGGGCLKLLNNTNPAAGANLGVLSLTDVYRSDVEGIKIDANKANQANPNGGYIHGILAKNFLFGTVKNCRIYECLNTGLYVLATSVYTDETQISGNYIDMCGGFGLVISGTGDHLVKDNHIKFNNAGNIWLTGTYNCTVEGNMVLSAGLDRYTFAVTGQGRGILIENSRGVVVKGNQCRSNTHEGIEIYQSNNANVVGNFLQYNSMYTAGSYSGILVYDSDDCIVANNHSADFDYAVQSAPFNVRHQAYGLKIDGNSLRARVTGNNFSANDNLTGGALITAGSTYQAHNNQGLADLTETNLIGTVYSCHDATPPTAGTWVLIGTQTIGAETVTYYKRTG